MSATTSETEGQQAATNTTSETTASPPVSALGAGALDVKEGEVKAEAPKAEAPKAEAPKAEAPKAEAPKAPIELKFPEGKEIKGPVLEKFKGLAGELGLDSPKAQKLIELYSEMTAEFDKEISAQFEAQEKQWIKELRADTELVGPGGKSLAASLQAANKAVEQFGGAQLKQVLAATGLTNNPAIVKAFAKIGATISEDSVKGVSGASTAESEETKLNRVYPKYSEQLKQQKGS